MEQDFSFATHTHTHTHSETHTRVRTGRKVGYASPLTDGGGVGGLDGRDAFHSRRDPSSSQDESESDGMPAVPPAVAVRHPSSRRAKRGNEGGTCIRSVTCS